MEFYLWFLFAAVISSFFWRFLNGKKKVLVFLLVILVPVLFSTFRNGIGTDYYVYLGHIDKYGSMGLFEYFSNASMEIGHYFILRLSYLLNNEYLFFFIYALLTVLFGYFAISSKELKSNNGLAWFIFLIFVFPLSFNIMKQALAISIILFSYVFIIKRDFKKFAGLVLLAFVFHTSAIVFLPCFFLPRIMKGKKQLVIVLVIILLSLIFFSYFEAILTQATSINVFNDYSYLLDFGSIKTSFNNYQKYISFAVLAISIILYRYYKHKNEFPLLVIMIIVLELTGVLLGSYSPYLKRISLYFTGFYPIVFSQFRLCFKNDKCSRSIIDAIIVLFFVFCYTFNYII